MTHRTLALLACGLLAQASAQAATYVADLAGTGFHVTNNGDETVPWTGQVTVVVDGTLDGTYSGDSLESITLSTNLALLDYTYLKGQVLAPYYYTPFDFILVGPEPGESVTIDGGRLVGFNLFEDLPYADASLSGMTASTVTYCKFDLECQGAPESYVLQGALTAAAVPEPASAALLLVGLGLAGCVVGRRRTGRLAVVRA